MKRVLIASDDAHTVAWIRQALAPLDVSDDACGAGELAVRLERGEVDLAVIDAGHSPDALLQKVEHEASKGAEISAIALVEPDALGSLRLPVRLPADFVVRGASADELAARARALLWPGEEATEQDLVRIDNLSINLATYQAYIGREPIDFTYLEYALFAFLVTHPNRTYSREMLLRRVWGTDYYGGLRTVDVHVRRVRSKLGPELSRRLETVRNVGYLWNG